MIFKVFVKSFLMIPFKRSKLHRVIKKKSIPSVLAWWTSEIVKNEIPRKKTLNRPTSLEYKDCTNLKINKKDRMMPNNDGTL